MALGRLNPVVAALLLVAAGGLPFGQGAPSTEFWVATSGSDASAGSQAAPFATLARAAAAVRSLPRPLPDGGATVHVVAGDYPLTETLALSGPADSGSGPAAPIKWQASRGPVRVLGGKMVPHEDAATRPPPGCTLVPGARVCDLKKAGLHDYGKQTP
eukprot:gene8502-7771_t